MSVSPLPAPLTAAVLAGGKSRRMGQDKAALRVGDETLLARTVRVAGAVAASVLVVGRSKPEDWPDAATVFLPDAAPEAGPLAGLVAALEFARGPVLLLGCDMPLLNAPALEWLTGAARSGGEWAATVAVLEGRLQPLLAVYTPDVLPDARARLEAGRRSLVGLIEDGDFARVTPPPDVARALADVDTPDDWRQVTRREAVEN